jgi:putative hydrolase of the HAD superfamily
MTATALCIDALGTILHLEPPAPRLQRSLESRLGLALPLDRCEAAMRAEMRHYRDHCVRARDAASLSALRLECADVLADALGEGLRGAELLSCLTDAIAFAAYPDAAPSLRSVRGAGIPVAVVSNWDISLVDTLARTGLTPLVDVVVHSAGVGASKPHPAPFHAALARLGVPAAGAVHVGDDPDADVRGARAAGLRALLLERGGRRRAGVLTGLDQVLDELARDEP